MVDRIEAPVRPLFLEFAEFKDGWRWSLTNRVGEAVCVSKPFRQRQSAEYNANLVIGPHTRTSVGTDGRGYEVVR